MSTVWPKFAILYATQNNAGGRQGLRPPAARILLFPFLTPYKTESKSIAHWIAYHIRRRIASAKRNFSCFLCCLQKIIKFVLSLL